MKIMKKIIILSTLLSFGIFNFASAQDVSVTSAFRSYKTISPPSISVPTVVEVPYSQDFIERYEFAVFDKTANSFEPYFFKQETLVNEASVSAIANPSNPTISQLVDKNSRTYAEFNLPENAQGQVQIILSSPTPITSSFLTLLLENNVALPNTIEIRAMVNGQNRIVVATRKMDQTTVRFPLTSSNQWTVSLTFGQLLRITELKLNQDTAVKSNTRAIRFLAQPGSTYEIFSNPDRSISVPVGESGNLASAKDVLVLPSVASVQNPTYKISDIDGDTIPDIQDNCVSTANSDQADINRNGRGDVCDDFDQDGVVNPSDNCPEKPNRDQADKDGDKIGDACDTEESRVTERLPWLPWAGIGFAALVIIILLVSTIRSTPKTPTTPQA